MLMFGLPQDIIGASGALRSEALEANMILGFFLRCTIMNDEIIYDDIIISLLIIILSYTCNKRLLVINTRNIKLFCSKMRRGWVLYLSCCGGPGFAMENLWRPPNDVADLTL